jgi:actin-like ATPase involved in cell morphogenesis
MWRASRGAARGGAAAAGGQAPDPRCGPYRPLSDGTLWDMRTPAQQKMMRATQQQTRRKQLKQSARSVVLCTPPIAGFGEGMVTRPS